MLYYTNIGKFSAKNYNLFVGNSFWAECLARKGGGQNSNKLIFELFCFTEQKIKGSVLKFMAVNASVEQLMACGLKEIGAQLEFQRFMKKITQQNMEGTDTEILNSSDSGSTRSVKTVKPTRNALKTMSDLDRKIYKAK